MHLKYPMLFVAAFIVLFSSCKKKEGPTGPQGPIGPAGPAYSGVITGHVSLYDQYGIRQYKNLGGIKVDLNGSVTTLTDSTGYYRFDSVATGNYNIMVSKAGYGATRSGYTAFVKDTLYKNFRMSAVPDFDLLSFAAFFNAGTTYDSVVMTVNADTRARTWIVFVSNKPGVSSSNYLLAFARTINPNLTRVGMRISAAELNSAGIFYGEMIYYAAYSYVVGDVSVYEDAATGNSIYTAVGTALVDTAIAP